MLNNLTGWHFVLATAAIVVLAIIVVAIRLARRNSPGAPVSSPDAAQQIEKLAQLRDKGLLSEAEYESKRTEVLGRI